MAEAIKERFRNHNSQSEQSNARFGSLGMLVAEAEKSLDVQEVFEDVLRGICSLLSLVGGSAIGQWVSPLSLFMGNGAQSGRPLTPTSLLLTIGRSF